MNDGNDIFSMRPAYLGDTIIPGAFSDNIGFVRSPRISLDVGFTALDENNEAVAPSSMTLDVIMLYENDSRIYYPKGSYDAQNPVQPLCFSDDMIAPDPAALQPQSDLCATCPRAVWDQPTPNGSLVPACSSRFKVACLVAGQQGKLFLLSVPPASRRPYQQYRRYLKANRAEANDVITKLTLDKRVLGFQPAGWVSEKTGAFIKQLAQTDEMAMLVGKLKGDRLPALPPRQATPPAIEKPVVEEKKPEPVIEEPKRRGRPAATPPKAEPAKDLFGPPPASPVDNSTPRAARAPGPKSNNQGFGMEAPELPPAEMQKALDQAFGPR